MFYVDISLTTKCDLSCKYCINSYLDHKDMPLSILELVFKFLAQNLEYISILTFNGIGNIFLYENLYRWYEYLKQMYFTKQRKNFLLSTKFLLIDDSLLNDLIYQPFVKNLIISIDGSLFFKNSIYRRKLIRNFLKNAKILKYFSVEIINLYDSMYLYKLIKFLKKFFLFKDIVIEKIHNWGGFFKFNTDVGFNKLINIYDNCYNYFPLYISPDGDFYFCTLKSWHKDSRIENIEYIKDIKSLVDYYRTKKDFYLNLCFNCSSKYRCFLYNWLSKVK